MADHNWCRFFAFLVCFGIFLSTTNAQCPVPLHFHGDWFSIEHGNDIDTLINADQLIKMPGENPTFDGRCVDVWNDNSTLDADGNHDSKILFFDSKSSCYICYYMLYRTPNILQYKQSGCTSSNDQPTLQEICQEISPQTDMATYFRKTMSIVNCKNTIEGVYHFSYEWDVGGGGICDSPYSQIVACQEPGSRYVDNQVFNMRFAKCREVTTSRNRNIRFQCMGTWTDNQNNVWSAVADLGQDVWRNRFRCMLTRNDQEEANNRRRATMSWWAQCSTLKSPYEGPVRLFMTPVVGESQFVLPYCNFPRNYTGTWYYTSEYDNDVTFNQTHIYFNTKIDQFWYIESYFICQMNVGTRYLVTALTVGKCEIDYVCYDMMPRHHSLVRWRMGKPYRMTSTEMSMPNWREYMFRQACTWSAFTHDRNEFAWKYLVFMLNPPAPIPCPVRGRYFFTQKGLPTELFRTRIRGYTERPRHMIDCRQYVAEFKSCDEHDSKLYIDAEYCETVDHIGRPVGEYDEADHELDCVGHWDEDNNSYFITHEPEDPVSSFRCWNYERTDWRFIKISRSVNAVCGPSMGSGSWHPNEGATLALFLTEAERLFDDCPQRYIDGDPWKEHPDVTDLSTGSRINVSFGVVMVTTLLALCAQMISV